MHGHAQGHFTEAAETMALLALNGGPGAAAGNITTFDQLGLAGATAVTTAAPATVTDETPTIFKNASGKFEIEAATSGTLNANVTSATVTLESSIDGGATWVPRKTVQLPAQAAAETVDSALFAVVDLSATITPALGAKFHLWVTLFGAGGTYTTVIHEGGLVAQELP